MLDTNWLRRFRRNVRAWYGKHGRSLAWRQAEDPYRIWISEIMLQQTTVQAVGPFFERFVQRFPDVHALAAASEQDVLHAWSGLGYYRRARNLLKAARVIVLDYDGCFPQAVDELRRLPGIGRYTAGAIASMAFGRKAPIVEANTLRLFTRLLAYCGDPRSTAGQQVLWGFAERILPRTGAGTFNQALMDLGATVCLPSEPDCSHCPVRSCCGALAQNRQADIPMLRVRKPMTQRREAAFAIRQNRSVLLVQRSEDEWWTGLWDFPRIAIDRNHNVANLPGNSRRTTQLPKAAAAELEQAFEDKRGMRIDTAVLLTTLEHTVTRHRITVHFFDAELSAVTNRSLLGTHSWISLDESVEYALTSPARKLMSRLKNAVASPS